MENNIITSTEETYLSLLYEDQYEKNIETTTNFLAQQTQTKAPTVTEMLKKLQKKNVVIYKPYKGVLLSEKGKKIALQIIRNKRLWNTYLVAELHFSWEDILSISEQTKHIKSDELINKIDKIVNYPKQDPFGDSIPNASGHILPNNLFLLSEAKHNDKCRISGIKNKSVEYIEKLKKYKILPFTTIKVIHKEISDSSLKIEFNNQQIFLPKEIVSNLLVNKTTFVFKLF